MLTGFIWLENGQVARSCEHGSTPSGSKKGGDFLTS
jgi:hypothetical protein